MGTPIRTLAGMVWSIMGYVVFDEEIGAKVEKIEIIPCRRCAEE